MHRATLRRRADALRIAGSVRLAEGVPAGDQRHGFLVVHRHAPERLADVARRRHRIGRAVRPLGIDVDEPHLHRAERSGQLAVAAVALVAEPGVLRAPEDLRRLPHIRPSEAEAERLEPHRFERDVAREHQQVRPRDLLSVLLLHRPEQPARLVEVGVVRPAVERRESLCALAGAAAPVLDAVGAGRVPAHTNEQRPVVPVVGRPPGLRRRHHFEDVLLERGQVQRLERLRVLEPGVHRACRRRMLMEHLEIELVRPPVAVGSRAVRLGSRGRDGGVFGLAGALGVLGHGAWSSGRGCGRRAGRYT